MKGKFILGDDNKIWTFPFDKIYDTPDLSVYNGFHIGCKRSYIKPNHASIMSTYLNEMLVLDTEDQFPLKYLNIKNKIDTEKYVMYDKFKPHTQNAYEAFFKDLLKEFFTPYTLNIIGKYVDMKMSHEDSFDYDKRIDRSNAKFSETLAFDNSQVRAIFIFGAACRLIMPLVTHYIYKYDTPFNQSSLLVYLAYMRVLKPITYLFPNINIEVKLYIYLDSIVKRSGITNRVHYNNAGIRGEHMTPMTHDMKPTIITDIIPRCLFDKNIMAFITDVANNFIDKNINKNHNVDYRNIRRENSGNDSSDFSDVDKLEASSAKINEIQSQMHMEYADDTIRRICIKYGIDHDYVLKIVDTHFDKGVTDNRHKLQEHLIMNFFAKDVGSVEAVRYYGGEEYEKLVIILALIMENSGFIELQYALTGIEVSQSMKRFLPKPVRNAIIHSSRYKAIVEKYGPMLEYIEKEKKIETAIMMIINAKYMYNHFHGQMKGSKDIVEFNLNTVCDEYLHFIQKI